MLFNFDGDLMSMFVDIKSVTHHLVPCLWNRHVSPKRRSTLNGVHGVISQKMELFITTAVRTSIPTLYHVPGNDLVK
jgi:hypothetical protein